MTFYTTRVESPCGPLLCTVDEAGSVVSIEFLDDDVGPQFVTRLATADHEIIDSTLRTQEVRTQLEGYFRGELFEFQLPVKPKGSTFQKEVWAELRRISYGETRTYGEIALAINHPRADRAVGAANGANPIPIIIPCHRVIGADGSLTGFGGGLAAKKLLLMLEARFRPPPVRGQLKLEF